MSNTSADIKKLKMAIKSHGSVSFRYKNKMGEVKTFEDMSPLRLVKDNSLLVCKGRYSDILFSVEGVSDVAFKTSPLVSETPVFPYVDGVDYNSGKFHAHGVLLGEKAEIHGIPFSFSFTKEVPFDAEYEGLDDDGKPVKIKLSTIKFEVYNKSNPILKNLETGLFRVRGVWIDWKDFSKWYKKVATPFADEFYKEAKDGMMDMLPFVQELNEYPVEVVRSFVQRPSSMLNFGTIPVNGYGKEHAINYWKRKKQEYESSVQGNQNTLNGEVASELVAVAKAILSE